MRNDMYEVEAHRRRIIIDTELLRDIFIDAIESESNYWAAWDTIKQAELTTMDMTHSEDPALSERLFDFMESSFDETPIYIYALEDEDEAVEPITMENFLQGVVRYLNSCDELPELEEYDAEVADAILQYAVFGTIIYG